MATNSPSRSVRSTLRRTVTVESPIWNVRRRPRAWRIDSLRAGVTDAGWEVVWGIGVLFVVAWLDCRPGKPGTHEVIHCHRNASTGLSRAARMAGTSAPRIDAKTAMARIHATGLGSSVFGIVSKA